MRKLFGTDGIRGIANEYPMNAELALKLGLAAGRYFEGKNRKSRIVVGKDTRLSCYIFENAIIAGLCSAGADVIAVGPMPTPAVSHLTKSFSADAGIVISASHNPSEYNGIKFFSGDGFKLPDSAEEEIEKLVFSENASFKVPPSELGRVYRINDASERYIEFAKSSVANISFAGLRIVLDCANGAAYKTAPKTFSELGADVIVLNNNPSGVNINRGCGALHPEGMVSAVKKYHADLGVALDGDADRVILCDENGALVDGDEIMAISALHFKKEGMLKKNTIVATLMSNVGLEILMKKSAIKMIRADVGDRYVVDEMRKGGFNLGGEQSGHIIYTESSTTGDGTIAALQILKIMKKNEKHLSELKMCMKKFPQTLLNIPVSQKKQFSEMQNFSMQMKKFERKLKGSGRIFVRYSGTENLLRILVEGKDKKKTDSIAKSLAETAKKELL